MTHQNPRMAGVTELWARDFDSADALRAAITTSSQPVLVVVAEKEVSLIVSCIRDCDGISLDTEPSELRNFRRAKLKVTRTSKTVDCFDPLTNVLNRQSLMVELNALTRAASLEQPVSVLLCDVDYFKMVNDQLGHAEGDRILVELASQLKNELGSNEAIGRLGGEEFGIYTPCSSSDARSLAEVLRIAATRIQRKDGAAISMSLGIATAVQPQSAGDLFDKANEALYSAKSDGRNCWRCYTELESESKAKGNDINVTGLESMARVLAERVANIITMKSRKLITHIKEEADVDGLTGCFNRRYLDRRLAHEFDDREGRPLSVAFLDLDHFGNVNKQFGWRTGDKLLVDVCDKIRELIRSGDWIGRYGGEEFCIVMPDTTANECKKILLRIRETIEATTFTSAKEDDHVPVTVSIGATNATRRDRDFSEMLDRASEMARQAKQNGRNQVCIA